MIPLFLGLILTPFISGLWFDPLFPLLGDIREAKEFIALIFALLIGLGAIYRGIKPMRNKWLLCLIGYLVMSVWYIPLYKINFGMWYGAENIAGIWAYKPIVYALVYFLMFLGVANLNLNFKKVFYAIMWVAVVLSAMIFLQYFKLDQLYIILPQHIIGQPTKPSLVATMGNPTFVGAFLAMCVPLVIRLRKYLALIVIIPAILLIQSQVATAALICALLVYAFLKILKYSKIIACGFTLLILVGSLFVVQRIDINDNGRFPVWKQVLTDIKAPPLDFGKESMNSELASKRIYPLTGLGWGSYNFIFINKHQTPFKQVHNEWLEFLYSCGIIGVALALGTLFVIVKKPFFSESKVALVSSLSAILVISLGTFVWQIEPHRFYTIALLGMLANDNKV